MMMALVWLLAAVSCAAGADGGAPRNPLDPCGAIHIPIGIANTVDTLKTFVEAEGNFSPGCGSYGVYFWLYDPARGALTAPTMPGVRCERGLAAEGFLIPWSRWSAGDVCVTTTVCEVQRDSPAGSVFVVGAKATVANGGGAERRVSLYVALRPVGPAGFAVQSLAVAPEGDALLVEGRPALVCNTRPAAAGVLPTDAVGAAAQRGEVPAARSAASATGDCSGAVRYELTLAPGATAEFGFVCPVLPGRRAVGHQWDGTSPWAQLDLNAPNPATGGHLQPDAGLEYYRGLAARTLFAEALAYWRELAGQVRVATPDPRWSQAFAAIVGHAALALNDGAPDVAVVNYNVFNRDGVYVANILQKAGRWDLAEKAIDYFLAHPFNGRVQVEADNPGQVLWALGQHWLFARDRRWLERVYPGAAKLAAMIRYYRTTPGPHFVKATSLEFGDALPPDAPGDRPANRRQVLRPGSCDGQHPEYTEAFDIAGLRAAAMLAQAAGRPDDARSWDDLAGRLLEAYGHRFGSRLPAAYGSYAVQWPCRLYPLLDGPAHQQFHPVGRQSPAGWRYFPLAAAHQGLLAGNRAAGHATLDQHLAHEQMAGWYAFDEGGGSGPGGWKYYRTRWRPGVAMPHGWAIAELWLLLRDGLAFEDDERLVLLAGVPPAWFTHRRGIVVENLPTHFGALGLQYASDGAEAQLELTGPVRPPAGFLLRLPSDLSADVHSVARPARADRDPLRQPSNLPPDVVGGGQRLERTPQGDVLIPPGVSQVQLRWADRG